MFEKYTSDVPAIPDPDYVWLNPENQVSFEERMLAEADDHDDTHGLRKMFESLIEAKKPGLPKAEFDDSATYFYSTNAQRFMDDVAVYHTDGTLNIDGTSTKIGIPYKFEMRHKTARGEIAGLKGSGSDEPIEIHLRKEEHTKHLQTTFGHEIGHFYWREVLNWGLSDVAIDPVEEKFCDYFGRRMAMPEDGLQSYETINEATLIDMMSKYRVDLSELMQQLMEYEILPRRVAVDSYCGREKNLDYSRKVNRSFFCQHCELVDGDYNCPEAGQNAPLFDFTDRTWASQLSNGCCGEDLHKANIMSTLTKYYVSKETQLILFRPGARFEDESQPLAVY